MNEEQQQIINKITKYASFEANNNMAIFEELQALNETLGTIANKPDIEIPETIIPPMPDVMNVKVINPTDIPKMMKVEVMNPMKMPEMDMSKTNDLLQKLVDKEEKDVDINVILTLE